MLASTTTAMMAIGAVGTRAGRNDPARAGVVAVLVTAVCQARQVGEQLGQFPGGAGLQGAAGPVF